jgi:hypothetical protein
MASPPAQISREKKIRANRQSIVNRDPFGTTEG